MSEQGELWEIGAWVAIFHAQKGEDGRNRNVLLAFQKKYLFLSYCPIAHYLKQHYPWLEQVCWSSRKSCLLLQGHHAHFSWYPPTSPMAHPSLSPCSLETTDISLTPVVFRATWGTVRDNFLYKNVIWLGESMEISALTLIEILSERQSSCRIDLSGVISPWCPVGEYSWLLIIVVVAVVAVVFVVVVLGKDHTLFFPPQCGYLLFFATAYIAYLNNSTCK